MNTRVLLAGTGTRDHRQFHQRDMYLPAIQAAGYELAGVVGGNRTQAAELVHDSQAPIYPAADLDRALEKVDLIVACWDVHDVDGLRTLLAAARERSIPIALDKPTLWDSATLAALAEEFPQGVTAAHPWRFHPAVGTARGRMITGGVGLVHAVHGELLVNSTDGPHPLGELRNLAVHCLDVIRSWFNFPLRGTAFAVRTPPGGDGSGEALTLNLRLWPDIAVSLIVGRGGGGVTTRSMLLHRYRVLSSQGQLLVDLDSPSVQVLGARTESTHFGPSPTQTLLETVAAGGAGPTLATAVELSAALDALETSAQEHRPVAFG